MEYVFLLSILFGLGILLQVFFLQFQNKSSKSILYLIGASIGALILSFIVYNDSHRQFDISIFILYFFIILSIGIAMIYKREILPEINEAHILSITILFWFIFLAYFYSEIWYKTLFAVISVFPTIGVIYISFTTFLLKNWTKLFFYIWFLVMMLFIIVSYFPFGNISFFWTGNHSLSPDPVTVFFSGMIFVYFIAYVAYLYYIIPIPGKHQSIKDRILESKHFSKSMTQNYSDLQLIPKYSFFLILIECVILLVNYYLNLIPNYLIISVIIVFIPNFFKLDKIRKKLLN